MVDKEMYKHRREKIILDSNVRPNNNTEPFS